MFFLFLTIFSLILTGIVKGFLKWMEDEEDADEVASDAHNMDWDYESESGLDD